MAQPKPPHEASHSLDAKGKPAPRNAREAMKPGGPIKPKQQGYVNPGPTDNLRGVEPNTNPHKGTPNPEQQGTGGKHGDHTAPPHVHIADAQHKDVKVPGYGAGKTANHSTHLPMDHFPTPLKDKQANK